MLEALINYELLRNTFFTGLLVGLIAPLLGTFIVVQRQAMIADGLSHVTLAGIAFGMFMQKQPMATMITPFQFGMIFPSLVPSLLKNCAQYIENSKKLRYRLFTHSVLD